MPEENVEITLDMTEEGLRHAFLKVRLSCGAPIPPLEIELERTEPA